MENKQSTRELLAALQKNDLFTDAHKAEILTQVLDTISDEDRQDILDLFKK